MTSLTPGVTRVEARRVRKCGDLQGEDQGLPRATHPTMIIPGQRQNLALQFAPQALSWKAALQMGWSLRGSGIVRQRNGTDLLS